MKRVLDYLLLGLIMCLFSCGEEHCKLDKELRTKEEKITMPQLKKILGNSIFRYEVVEKGKRGMPKCLQIMTYFDVSKAETTDITKNKEYILIFRSGNGEHLEGFDEYHKELNKLGRRFGTLLGEAWFVSFDNVNSQIKITEYYKSDKKNKRFAILEKHKMWGNDVVWIKYNATKDVLEVKLKTPLTAKKAGPIVYELKRVQNDITDTWV